VLLDVGGLRRHVERERRERIVRQTTRTQCSMNCDRGADHLVSDRIEAFVFSHVLVFCKNRSCV
jgi:hypothetical protein